MSMLKPFMPLSVAQSLLGGYGGRATELCGNFAHRAGLAVVFSVTRRGAAIVRWITERAPLLHSVCRRHWMQGPEQQGPSERSAREATITG